MHFGESTHSVLPCGWSFVLLESPVPALAVSALECRLLSQAALSQGGQEVESVSRTLTQK